MALKLMRFSGLVSLRRYGSSLANIGLPPVAKFTKLSDGTPEDFQNAQVHFAKLGSVEAIAKRLLGLVEGLEGLNIGNLVDLKVFISDGTRALKARAKPG